MPASWTPPGNGRRARFAVLASRLSDGPGPGRERAWACRHAVERDNFAAAARWLQTDDPPVALALLVDIYAGMDEIGDSWQLDLLRVVLQAADGATPADRADALGILAWDDSENGLPRAFDELREAVELLALVDDPVVECSVLVCVAKCEGDLNGGRLDAGKVAAAIAAADRAGGTYWPVKSRQFLASQAPPEIGEPLLADALQIAQRTGLDDFAAAIRGDLAGLTQFRSDSATVLATWQDVVGECGGLDRLQWEHGCLYALAEGEHATLTGGLGIAEQILVGLADTPLSRAGPATFGIVAHLRVLADDLDKADEALEALGRAGQPEQNFLGGLSIVTRSALWRRRSQPGQAATTIASATYHIGFRGSTDISMRVLEELAAVAADLDQPQHAADVLATADQARRHEHKPRSPACAIEVDVVRARVQTRRGTPLETADAMAVAHTLASATR